MLRQPTPMQKEGNGRYVEMEPYKRCVMKKMNSLAVSVFLIAHGVSSQVQAQPAPLSCNMQMLLNGTTALFRDQGIARKDAKIANTPDTDLTKKEIKTILDRVYVTGKNQTPDQIKDDVYRRCENGR